MSDPGAAQGTHAEHYDPMAAKIGMWLFLFTEILLFGTLFLVYADYLYQYKWQFQAGSAELNISLGAVNTLILLTSSLVNELRKHIGK